VLVSKYEARQIRSNENKLCGKGKRNLNQHWEGYIWKGGFFEAARRMRVLFQDRRKGSHAQWEKANQQSSEPRRWGKGGCVLSRRKRRAGIPLLKKGRVSSKTRDIKGDGTREFWQEKTLRLEVRTDGSNPDRISSSSPGEPGASGKGGEVKDKEEKAVRGVRRISDKGRYAMDKFRKEDHPKKTRHTGILT